MSKINRGTTLIETVVYLGLLSVFMAMFVPWFFDLNAWKDEIETNVELVYKHTFIEGIIADTIRNSDDVNSENIGRSFDLINFSRTQNVGFEILSFSINKSGLDLGTTSYPMQYE